MKVAIGYEIIEGPWGGGNRFVSAMATALSQAGHDVVFSLTDHDIDLILLIDPRKRSKNIPFGPGEVLRYLNRINSNTLVVQRINECDERKNTKTMNFNLRTANYVADHTIFVGSWLKELNVWQHGRTQSHNVILNGADPDIFHPSGYQTWDQSSPLKLVTHHWGGNWMKGFDIYEKIDSLIDESKWRNRLEFTYIGNLPKGFQFKNTRYIQPLDGHNLANAIRSNHVYITGSQNEPGGNHQNEGAMCGLPLLFRNSGCLPEYCKGFGIPFNSTNDLEWALERMYQSYNHFEIIMSDYPHTIEKTVQEYLNEFNHLMERKAEITANRNLRWHHLAYLLNWFLL